VSRQLRMGGRVVQRPATSDQRQKTGGQVLARSCHSSSSWLRRLWEGGGRWGGGQLSTTPQSGGWAARWRIRLWNIGLGCTEGCVFSGCHGVHLCRVLVIEGHVGAVVVVEPDGLIDSLSGLLPGEESPAEAVLLFEDAIESLCS
jgi:uncharacterized membrane protein